MYVIKVSDSYFTGVGLSVHQSDAKRFALNAPTSTFRAYLDLLFGTDARFVKLTSRHDRIVVDTLADYDNGNDLW